MTQLSALTDPNLAIIFETSPLGLGHLRVTDALYHGLPKSAAPILFGAQAPKSSALYRFASVHRSTRRVLEMLQLPPLDKPVAAIGRQVLRHQTKDVYESLKRILNERFSVPQKVLLVATHAIHAHPLGAIKAKLSMELGVKAFLVVQVTDDSPQAIWYVPDADLIVVPSVHTKEKLQAYARRSRLPDVPIMVAAYPISPLLTEEITEHMAIDKREQCNPYSQHPIHISVPIPGAAVGTMYMERFIQGLHHMSARYLFHIVVREAGYTLPFIRRMSDLPYNHMSISTHERTTVDNYEKVYREHTIVLEMTKPSEQAFKVLATPQHRGGALMLFTKPVGGQEYDNVRFLHRHGFVPSALESQALWQMAQKRIPLEKGVLHRKAEKWRGLMLPDNPEHAAQFVHWCLTQRIFTHMLRFTQESKSNEVQSNGVSQFWNGVAALLVS